MVPERSGKPVSNEEVAYTEELLTILLCRTMLLIQDQSATQHHSLQRLMMPLLVSSGRAHSLPHCGQQYTGNWFYLQTPAPAHKNQPLQLPLLVKSNQRKLHLRLHQCLLQHMPYQQLRASESELPDFCHNFPSMAPSQLRPPCAACMSC